MELMYENTSTFSDLQTSDEICLNTMFESIIPSFKLEFKSIANVVNWMCKFAPKFKQHLLAVIDIIYCITEFVPHVILLLLIHYFRSLSLFYTLPFSAQKCFILFTFLGNRLHAHIDACILPFSSCVLI